jgi:molybdopterin-guanine dinucleotide biosynthesis protein A
MVDYTLIILAGGQGQRMGGADKGLVELDGKPLVAHLLDNLLPRPSRIVISANRNIDRYHAWGDEVVADLREGFCGPLAGLETALAASHGLCLCLPCDLLKPAAEMIEGLLASASSEHICVVHDTLRRQPLCMALYAEHWQGALGDYLDAGKRSAHGWLDQVPVHPVTITTPLQNLNDIEKRIYE